MNVYAIMSLVALCANLAVGLYVLTRGPRNTLNRLFFAVMMSLAVWSAGEFAMRLSKTGASAFWAGRIAAIGWCLVGGFFILFALALSDNLKAVRDRRVQVACLLPGAMVLALTWSTHTIFKNFTRSYWGFEEVAGTLRLPSKLFVVAMFIIGGVILLRFFRVSPSRYKRVGAGYVLIALAIPLAAGVVTDVILPVFGVLTVELPMFASTACAPIIAYAVLSLGIMTTIAGRLGGTIITRMNDAVFVTNAEGRIETMNPAASRLTGYGESELLENTLDLVFIAGPSLGKIGDGRQSADVGRWNLCATRQGDMVPVTVSSSEVRRKGGKLLGAVTVAHDMREALRLMQAEHEVKMATARVAAERDRSEVLKASEEEVRKLSRFLESVIENIAEPLFIMDTALRYVYVNEAFSTLIGCCRDDVIGRRDGELHWEEHAEFLSEYKRRVFDSSEMVEMPEVSFLDLEGDTHVTRTVMAPMRNTESEVEYLVGVINDLTEQKRLESARLDFIRIAAHELRTPLTSLKLGFDILARETRGALNDEQ
ncbi:MAG TPA: PAS domain S-box protein, partial [Candidatus Anoxymicrobiaceae bacterium]